MAVNFEPRTPAALVNERPLEGVRALVVEDHDDSRELVRQILEHAGATVEEVASAELALVQLAARPFDVMVSDIGMPQMDGLQLMTTIRGDERPAVAQTAAVALSAHARATDRSAALAAGFHAHVCKPVDPEELVAVVRSVLPRL
jgi:CheY-like chemotaxis protein